MNARPGVLSHRVACVLLAAAVQVLLGPRLALGGGNTGDRPSAPASAGTLRLARLFDPVSLDPARQNLQEDLMLMPLLHLPLLDVKGGTNLFPCAAREWSASSDQRTHTIRLRAGILFSNGRPVVAADYVFALERILNPATGSMWSSYLGGIRGAKAFSNGTARHVAGLSTPTADTLIVELDQPDPVFPYVLMWPPGVAVPAEEIARDEAHYGVAPVGTGPYRVRTWRRGVELRLVRNPRYAGPTPPHLEGVNVMIGGDEATHLMMFERGELEIANITGAGIPLPSFRRLMNDARWRPGIEYAPLMNTTFITLNTEIPPLTNVLVRRAINHAIQRDRWMRVATHHFGHAEGTLPTTLPGFDPALRGYAYDPELARRLLATAGVSLPLHTVLWHAIDEQYRFAAEGVQGDLREVGIMVDLQSVTIPQLIASAETRGKVPMALTAWNVSIPDPVDMLGTQLDGRTLTNSPTLNYAFYRNPEVDHLLDLAAPEVDLPRRFGLYRRAEQLIVEDAPWVFLGHQNLYALRQPWLKGPLIEPLWWYRFDRVWIEH
jgi:ABC-type transport system substrate-binding protein